MGSQGLSDFQTFFFEKYQNLCFVLHFGMYCLKTKKKLRPKKSQKMRKNWNLKKFGGPVSHLILGENYLIFKNVQNALKHKYFDHHRDGGLNLERLLVASKFFSDFGWEKNKLVSKYQTEAVEPKNEIKKITQNVSHFQGEGVLGDTQK